MTWKETWIYRKRSGGENLHRGVRMEPKSKDWGKPPKVREEGKSQLTNDRISWDDRKGESIWASIRVKKERQHNMGLIP